MREPARMLIVVAVPREARAVRAAWEVAKPDAELHSESPSGPSRGLWDLEWLDAETALVVGGVGKAAAAGATAWALGRDEFLLVVNAGVAGTLRADVPIGTVIAADRSVFADEGSVTPGGWRSITQMGFPACRGGDLGVAGDAAALERLRAAGARTGVVATVSTCSGTDAAAREVAARTGAAAEAMEGAAIGSVVERFGEGESLGFVEVRAISNTTGDRERQVWDLDRALRNLTEVLGRWLRGG